MKDKENGVVKYQSATTYGISINLKTNLYGFEYLRSAVLLCLKEEYPALIGTSEIYSSLAKIYDTTDKRIERCIRSVVEDVHKNNGLFSLNEHYDAIVYTKKYSYSGGELIMVLTEGLKLQELRQEICDRIKLLDSLDDEK